MLKKSLFSMLMLVVAVSLFAGCGKPVEKAVDETPQENVSPDNNDAAAKAGDKNNEVTPESKSESQPEANPETKPEDQPEANTETNPEANTEVKPETNTETKPEAITETKPEANTETKPEPKQETAATLKPVTLKVFSTYEEDVFQRTVVDPIKKKYPQVTLQHMSAGISNLTQLVAANDIPDIIIQYFGTLRLMKELKLEYDLTDLIKKYDFMTNRLDVSLTYTLQTFSPNNEIYALPKNKIAAALLYNKNIFDMFAINYPEDRSTWDDVIKIARQTTRVESGIQYYGITNAQHNLMLQQLSADYFDEKGNIAVTSSGWVAVANQLKTLSEIPGYDAWAARPKGQNGFLKDQTVAMHHGNILDVLASATEFDGVLDWDMVSYPTFPQAPGIGPNLTEDMYAITSVSKEKDAAFQVITHLLSDEVQTLLSQTETHLTPLVNREVQNQFAANNSVVRSKNLSALSLNTPAVISDGNDFDTIAKKVINDVFKKVELGQQDVNTLLREAHDRIEKDIKGNDKSKN